MGCMPTFALMTVTSVTHTHHSPLCTSLHSFSFVTPCCDLTGWGLFLFEGLVCPTLHPSPSPCAGLQNTPNIHYQNLTGAHPSLPLGVPPLRPLGFLAVILNLRSQMASKAQRRAIIAKHNGVCDHCKKKGSQVPPPFHHKHHPPKSFPTIYSDNVFDLRGGGKPLILDYQLLSIPRMRVWLAMFVFTRIVARPTVARHRAPALALAPPRHPLLLHLPRAPRPRPPSPPPTSPPPPHPPPPGHRTSTTPTTTPHPPKRREGPFLATSDGPPPPSQTISTRISFLDETNGPPERTEYIANSNGPWGHRNGDRGVCTMNE